MFRLNLVLAAAPVGLATGLLAWTAAGGSDLSDRLGPLEPRLAALASQPPAGRASTAFVPVASLVSSPLFLMTVGPGAVSEPAVRLEGISLSRRRMAALISIADGAAEWMTVGESRGGVTLQQIGRSMIVVETLLGQREVALGERISGATSGASEQAVVAAVTPQGVSGPETIPPGFRSPPPPASAPGAPR